MAVMVHEAPLRSVFRGFLWLMAVISLGNAVWMLLHAWSWFAWIPGVSDTGSANAHFIHDVGVAYATCGIGFVWCARNLAVARPVYLGITLFFVGHALGHVVEIALGQLPPAHWWIDFPLVFAPAIILLCTAMPRPWRRLTATRGA